MSNEDQLIIAAGELFVYDINGKYLRTMHVPERPTELVRGGENNDRIFVLTRTKLYELNSLDN